MTIKPRTEDVLLGRGRKCQVHAGNQRMLAIIDSHHIAYTSVKREERRALAATVLEEILEGGVRFLKRSSNDEKSPWEEVDRVVALDKVSHALRCKTRKYLRAEREQKENEAAPRTSPPDLLPSTTAGAAVSAGEMTTQMTAMLQPPLGIPCPPEMVPCFNQAFRQPYILMTYPPSLHPGLMNPRLSRSEAPNSRVPMLPQEISSLPEATLSNGGVAEIGLGGPQSLGFQDPSLLNPGMLNVLLSSQAHTAQQAQQFYTNRDYPVPTAHGFLPPTAANTDDINSVLYDDLLLRQQMIINQLHSSTGERY